MRKTGIAVCLMATALLCFGPGAVRAQENQQSEAQRIEQQQAEIDALKARLADLEGKLVAPAQPQQDLEDVKATVEKLKDTVTDAEGPVQTVINDVAKLKKIKVSGYVQGRFESYQAPSGLANKGDNKTVDNRFYLRRARFKITGQPTANSIGVVQWDVAGFDRAAAASKDVYLEYHPWGVGTPAPFLVRFGQQNWPFGYVIERSSSAREVPERPKVFAGTTVSLSGYPSFGGLFPGERDKGISLVSTEGSNVEWALGLFNGTGTSSGAAGSAFLESGGKFEDNNSNKAIVGRVRIPFGENLKVGVSGYTGSQAVRLVSDAASAVNVDQTRWGADFQYYLLGASIKGEYVTAKQPYFSNTTTTPDGKAGTNRTVKGWYLVGVKNLGTKHQAVVQYDVLNDQALASTFGALSTWNLGLIRYLDDATRLKVFYEKNSEEHNEVATNGWRVEVINVF